MSFQITGKLLDIGEIVQRTDKFSTRDIVVLIEKFYKKEDQSYPLRFQAINNKCIEMDSLSIKDALRLGLNVMINFDLDGYESKSGVVWNNLKIVSIVPSQVQPKLVQSQIPTQPIFGDTFNPKDMPFVPVSKPGDYPDDLPF